MPGEQRGGRGRKPPSPRAGQPSAAGASGNRQPRGSGGRPTVGRGRPSDGRGRPETDRRRTDAGRGRPSDGRGRPETDRRRTDAGRGRPDEGSGPRRGGRPDGDAPRSGTDRAERAGPGRPRPRPDAAPKTRQDAAPRSGRAGRPATGRSAAPRPGRASDTATSHGTASRSRRAAGPGSSSGQRASRADGERAADPRRGTAANRPARRPPRPGDDRPGLRIGDEITADQLDPAARAELRTLPSDLADSVGRYLVASGLAEDPVQGYRYAKQARKLAARVGVVREASGIAAYRASQWADALAELRAARRLTGRDIGLPLMADSERALGRLDRALAIVRDPQARTLDRATQIELAIVESGIRRDQGMAEAALLALQVPELTDGRSYPWSARLFYAYADALLEAGRRDEAHDWFARAAAADTAGETDAAERYEELDDVVIEDLAET